MKNFIVFTSILFLISCKKEYTCKCEAVDSNGDVVERKEFTVESKEFEDAEATCKEEEGQFTEFTRTCKLEGF